MLIATLLITLCSPAGDCRDYAPATYMSPDYTALHDCDALAAGMPAPLEARCVAEFSE